MHVDRSERDKGSGLVEIAVHGIVFAGEVPIWSATADADGRTLQSPERFKCDDAYTSDAQGDIGLRC